MSYLVEFTYQDPKASGPFMGSAISENRFSPGELFHAEHGVAVVDSCKRLSEAQALEHRHGD